MYVISNLLKKIKQNLIERKLVTWNNKCVKHLRFK